LPYRRRHLLFSAYEPLCTPSPESMQSDRPSLELKQHLADKAAAGIDAAVKLATAISKESGSQVPRSIHVKLSCLNICLYITPATAILQILTVLSFTKPCAACESPCCATTRWSLPCQLVRWCSTRNTALLFFSPPMQRSTDDVRVRRSNWLSIEVTSQVNL
jgi:hypothetical protein